MKKKILVLCGGVGGAKLAYGLSKNLYPEEVVFLVNTGDDFNHYNLYISPDLDTVMYTLAGINDPDKGWGLKDETWNNLNRLKKLGVDTWFQLGDKDLATHIKRTELINEGKLLSEVTESLCSSLDVKYKIFPMSETVVSTKVKTNQGELSFQEYFVKNKCVPKVKEIKFKGNREAVVPLYIKEQIKRNGFRGVIICPSNPFLSVDPILSIKEIKDFLIKSNIPKLAVSPIINNKSVKGPTVKIMKEMGINPSIESIVQHYEGIIDILLVDAIDKNDLPKNMDIQFNFDSILMDSEKKKISLAKTCLEKLEKIT
tara:strand:+ start:750 stop:1691 length:942 start_codon:yes stop_codon:yes gene_type:complete